MNRNDVRTKARIERIKLLLKDADVDQWQLADRLPLARRYTRDYVQNMHAAGELHFVGWKRYSVTGKYIPVCRLGPGVSVPMPGPVSEADRKRNERKAMRADPARHNRFKAGQRARRKKPPKADPLLAALFGAGKPSE
jgi:hypothetical protein